jgi:hypothetical protein
LAGPILDRYLAYRHEVARAFVDQHWPQVVAVADALLTRKSLNQLELRRVVLESLGYSETLISAGEGRQIAPLGRVRGTPSATTNL